MRDCRDFTVKSITDEQFARLEECLRSFHDFCHQLLAVLYILQRPHTNCDLIKTLRPNGRLGPSDLEKWRLDPEHGLLHGLITAYFAVKLAGEWTVPELRGNVEAQRLIASCLVHDYAKVAGCREPHDEAVRAYFPLLLPETYCHSTRPDNHPLVLGDRLERLQDNGESQTDVNALLEGLPHSTACFEVWAFYAFIRPALTRLFRGRTQVWLRHGAEEADWRWAFSHEPMESRSKDFWPNFYLPWAAFPGYWAVEVGQLTPYANMPHVIDNYFPAGLMTIDEYRACEEKATIVSAPWREHEIAFGKIPLRHWIFVLRDHQLPAERYLLTASGGFVTFPILTNIIDVADALYSKLYAIG